MLVGFMKYGTDAESYEHGVKLSGSFKEGEILYELSDYQFIKKHSALCNQL
jgi:hypothetical protein